MSLARAFSVSEKRAFSVSETVLPLGAQDLHLWLCSRGKLADSDQFRREVLSRYAPLAPAEWQFQPGEQGKPMLVETPRPLDFNCSDSGDWLACAVTAGTGVGIDIEYCDARRDVMKLARRFFRDNEVADLRSCDQAERKQRFYDYWTLKEARIKAMGASLGVELENTGFDLAPPAEGRGEPGIGVIATRAPASTGSAYYCLLQAVPDYRLAACWLREPGPGPRLRLFELRGKGAVRVLPLTLRAASGGLNRQTD